MRVEHTSVRVTHSQNESHVTKLTTKAKKCRENDYFEPKEIYQTPKRKYYCGIKSS